MNRIIADGPLRFFSTKEYRLRRRELWQTVGERFAGQLAGAGFFRRLLIRYRWYRAYRLELRRIIPSPQSCWSILGQTWERSRKNHSTWEKQDATP